MDTPDLDAPVIHANGDALPIPFAPSDSSDDSDSEEEDSTDSNEQQKVCGSTQKSTPDH